MPAPLSTSPFLRRPLLGPSGVKKGEVGVEIYVRDIEVVNI